MYASRLGSLAKNAKAKHLGLWESVWTVYHPYRGIETRR